MTPGSEAPVPVRLSAEALIDLSEAAAALSPARWSLACLGRGYKGWQDADLRALPLGQRDAMMLGLRRALKGDVLSAEPTCQSCTATFELRLAIPDLGYDAAREVPGQDSFDLRPVTLGDMLAVEHLAAPQEAEAELIARLGCGPSDDLADRLEALDPMADVWISCACPECGQQQDLALDVVGFVAREVRQIATRTMRDVADIARVFHWSEADILRLPEARRAFYLSEALA